MELSKGLFAIRKSIRAFARTPRLTLVLLLSIALGVGSNVSIFGFVQGLVNPGSPANHGGRIVSVVSQDKTNPTRPLTRDQFQSLRNHNDAFVWVNAARIVPTDVDLGSGSEVATVAAVMPDLAEALNLPENTGVVMSHRMWQREFGGNTNAIGYRIRLSNVQLSITGIAPDHLDGLYRDQAVDFWTHLESPSPQGADRNSRDLLVFARLRDGVSLSEAQKDVRLQLGNSDDIYVAPYSGTSPAMAKGLSQIGAMLDFSCAAVFLVACCVVASLLIGRALKRIHIMSINVALGATRLDLMMELLSDSIVISLAGGVLGVLLGLGAARVLPSLLFPEDAERLVFAPHLLTVIASSVSCVAIIIACGFIPVLAATTHRPWNVMRRESGLPSTVVVRLRAVLVAGQITICCALTIFTTVILERFHTVLKTRAGNDLGNLVLASVQPQTGLPDKIGYFQAVEQKLKSMPGLSTLAWTSQIPGSLPDWRSFRVQKPPSPPRDVQMGIAGMTSSRDSLEGLPVFGRLFEVRDQLCSVAVVNEKSASNLFGKDTVGTIVQAPNGVPMEIVGVVKPLSSDGANGAHQPTIYYNDSPEDQHSRIAGTHFRTLLATTSRDIELNVILVSPSYLRALGLSLTDGHWISERETDDDCIRSSVINQEAADAYFGDKPVGAVIVDGSGVRTRINGVVKTQSLRTFERHTEPTIYLPMREENPSRLTLVIRASKDNPQIMTELRRRIDAVPGSDSASLAINTMDDKLADSGLAPLRIATLIFASSAVISFVLSILGLLSVHSETERQRRRELALRLALGAQRRHIFIQTIKQIGRLASAGILAGTLVSIAGLRIFATDLSVISSPPIQVWFLAPILSMLTLTITAAIVVQRAMRVKLQAIMREDD